MAVAAPGRRSEWLRRCAAAAGAAGVLAAGCSPPGDAVESAPDVQLTAVDVPLREPVWSYRRHTLVALTDDHRVAEISDAGRPAGRTRLSGPLAAGRNLQISRNDDRRVFVPQPRRARVAVVDLASLRAVAGFAAGPAPSYLSANPGLRMLLVLSADGLSITPVAEYGWNPLPTATTAESADTVAGANRGREVAYQLFGPAGVRHYQGTTSPPEERGRVAIDVAASAGDGAKVSRSYVAPRHENVVYAIDSRRGGQGMEVVGRAELPSPVRLLGTDDTRVYAATDHEVAVLEAASVTGYPHGDIRIIRVIDYRSGLPAGALHTAPLSGMAIGPHRVYLTVAGRPRIISVAKPRL